MLRKEGQWRYFDTEFNLMAPWYTLPCLEWLKSRDFKHLKVFEYGAGDSTLWWRKQNNCIAVDTNFEWANKSSSFYEFDKEQYLKSISSFAPYDIIIIDGEPVEWRDDCAEYALKCIKKGGFIIADNYHQNSCDLPPSRWIKTDKTLEGHPRVVFSQPGHDDWSTAVWQIC